MRNKFIPVNEQQSMDLGSEPPAKTKGARHWSVLPVQNWTGKQFEDYFTSSYLDLLKFPHPAYGQPQRGKMKRIMNLYKDNAVTKRAIDLFFTMDYPVKTVDFFSSSVVQGEIQTYMATGQNPRLWNRQGTKTGRHQTQAPNQSAAPSSASFEDFFGGGK